MIGQNEISAAWSAWNMKNMTKTTHSNTNHPAWDNYYTDNSTHYQEFSSPEESELENHRLDAELAE